MFRVLRFAAKATLADVARSVSRTPARRIAIVFPPGERTRFADAGRMDMLASICREHGKDATIVGGDELLRACAVACGLRAAVTLDDWRDAQPVWGLRRPRLRSTPPALRVILGREGAPGSAAEGDVDLDDGSLDVDPPEYVQELLALYQGSAAEPASPVRLAWREPIVLPRPFVVAAHSFGLPYDLDSDDSLRALAEDDEERLTATIRRTSGFDEELFAWNWRRELDADAPGGQTGSR